MTAALHLVPDPDEEPTLPPDTAGEQPTEAATAAVEEPGEENAPDEDADLDEEPARVRALAMPNLRPYASLAWIPATINAGVEGARRRHQRAPERKAARRAAKAQAQAAGEPMGRARLWAMAADYLAGTRLLLGYLAAWLGGEYGPKDMKVPARLAAVGFAGYCGYRTVTSSPVWGTVGLTVVYCAAALGALHQQRAEQGKKQPTGTATKGVAKAPGPPPAQAAEQTPAETPADAPAEDAEQAPAEAVEETPAEPQAPPSREAIAGALHHLYRGGSGVLLTTLRQHLSLPHTRAVREVLDGAGIRVREGVRTPGGNGPGIHTHDFPPPPPSPDPAHGDPCLPRSGANNNNANAESGPQKGLRADGSYWPPGKPYHYEAHPDNPDRTVIVHHGDEQ